MLLALSVTRGRALCLLSLAELLAMSLWFGASSVSPAIRAEWRLDEQAAGWLTLAVQLGFVTGTLFAATFNLPDVLRSRHLVAIAALLGAASNALFALSSRGPVSGMVLRFLTGFFLAVFIPGG